ncbi:MAG: methyl-accepting chemotaxis protein [Candidatus Sumerlaeia bacterium]
MFKQMKLGAKIGAGFGTLVVIVVLLGGLAVFNMGRVKGITANLVDKAVPEVVVANGIERNFLQGIFELRAYNYTEDPQFLDAGRKQLALVADSTKKGLDLAEKQKIETLKQNIGNADSKVKEYQSLLDETVIKTNAIAKSRNAFNELAAKYQAASNAYMESQDKQQAEEYKEAVEAAAGANKAELLAKLEARAWKKNMVAEASNIFTGIRLGVWKGMATRDPKVIAEAQKKFDDVNKKLDELQARTKLEADVKALEDWRVAGKAYNDELTNFLANFAARDELNKKRVECVNVALQVAKDTASAGMDEASKGATQASGALTTASSVMVIGLIIATIISITMAIFITRSITGPINKVIAGLTQGAEQIASASGQVAQSSQQMAEGASEQASSLEEVSSSLEEMASMTRQNTDNAKQATSQAGEARSAAEKGSEVMEKMSVAIDKIKASSDETAKILKTIDEIAFQTNLLALNAAVEAARAGDAGKGFAVVAEEVRNLAMRSAEAAKSTASLIEASQKNADNGVQVSADVTQILKQIVTGIQKVTQLNSEVSAASDEQTQGIDQINTAVAQLDKVTQSNAANAEESASAAEELSAQAREMNDMVNMLVSIVRGATEASMAQSSAMAYAGAHSGPSLHHPAAGKAKFAPAGGNKKAMAHAGQARASKPEEVIPLNDSDLSEF